MAAVRRHGHNGDTVVYDDWAKSGDQRKLASRRAWRELCEAIDRGGHDVVFMNDLDRGGRSLEEWLRFIRIAQDHRVRVIAGDTDYSAPENKDRLIFEAWLAERELDAAKRRAAATIRMREGRGDVMGQPPYGYRFAREDGRVVLVADEDRPLQPVLDAVKDAGGNTREAVRLLNDRGVPSRYGKAWSDAALRQVLRRNGAMPPATTKLRSNGHGQLRAPSPLSKLVRCHCGQTMTPVDSRRELYCYVGSREGGARHGKMRVHQRHVYDYLRAEIPRRKVVPILRAEADAATAEREKLEEELRRLGRAYRAGAVPDDEFDAESTRLRDAIARLPAEGADWIGVGEPHLVVDFDGDPVALGEALRQRIVSVNLDEDLRPTSVDWRGTSPTAERKARAERVAARRSRPVTEAQRRKVREASATSQK